MKQISFLVAILGFSLTSYADDEFKLAPFKNELFLYREATESKWDAQFRVVPFDKQIDEYGRDQEGQVLKRAKPEYVSEELLQDNQRFRVLKDFKDKNQLESFEVGNPINAKFAVIFMHGGTPERGKLGMEDWRFGGNFNRLKNLVLRNQGVFYSPSVSLQFTDSDAALITGLIGSIRKSSPRVKIIVACASSGGKICNKLAFVKDAGSQLNGLIYMGGPLAQNIETSPAAGSRVPIYIAQGEEDRNVPHAAQFARFLKLRENEYPTLYVAFKTGAHGTPIRMLDWFEALNWIFSEQPNVP
jgi:predicted esterase